MSEMWWVCSCVLSVHTLSFAHNWPRVRLPTKISSVLGVPALVFGAGVTCIRIRKRSSTHCSVAGVARLCMCRVCVHTCMLAQLGSPGQSQPSCLVVSVLCRHMACFYSLCFSLSFFIPFSSSSHSVIKQNKLSSLSSARRLVVFTSYPSTVCHLRWDFSSKGWRASPARGRVWWPLAPCQALPQQAWWNLLPICYDLADSIDHIACMPLLFGVSNAQTLTCMQPTPQVPLFEVGMDACA